MVSKTVIGETPNGGVKSTIFFQDSEGRAVDEKEATHCEIVEYDASGKAIARTYGTYGDN